MSEKLLKFPCDYPIKVVADVRAGLFDQVYDAVERHDATMTIDRVSQKVSRKGNFISISFLLNAINEEQIEALFQDLKKIESVRLVL
jgi:putative lipoic acid-binding regulatory protein